MDENAIKVIYVDYDGGIEFISENPEEDFRVAVDILAHNYKAYGGQADFGIIDSRHISDICFSSQCFFPKDLEEALQRQGIEGVKVEGICGGTHDYILERIKEYGENIEYLNGERHAVRDPVLYKFERRGETKMDYSNGEKELIKLYEQRTGTKFLGREERIEAYRQMSLEERMQQENGIRNAISGRLNLDNQDVFDEPDDVWKLKMLKENLELILKLKQQNKEE